MPLLPPSVARLHRPKLVPHRKSCFTRVHMEKNFKQAGVSRNDSRDEEVLSVLLPFFLLLFLRKDGNSLDRNSKQKGPMEIDISMDRFALESWEDFE